MKTDFNIKAKTHILDNIKIYDKKIDNIYKNIESFCADIIKEPKLNKEIISIMMKENPELEKEKDYSKNLVKFNEISNEFIKGCISITINQLFDKHNY